VKELIDELYQTDFLKQTLKLSQNVQLNLDKLIVSGHSMGGATALRVGNSDERVKGVLTNDPWLMPISEDITTDKLNFRSGQHVFIANSEHFLKLSGGIETSKTLVDT
jgi:alpha-beta hydrolase superfamily lysophospholipase